MLTLIESQGAKILNLLSHFFTFNFKRHIRAYVAMKILIKVLSDIICERVQEKKKLC